MEIDIRNFLNAHVGKKETYEINEQEVIQLTEEAKIISVNGTLDLISIEDNILATFDIRIKYGVVCIRCLEDFKDELDMRFDREYSFDEEEGKIKIDRNLTIDITEPIREEAILNLPMKAICKEKCEGVKNE